MFDINEFVNNIAPLGFQKPSRFGLFVAVPPGFASQYDNSFMLTAAQNLQFWSNSADFPGLDIALNPIRPYGYGPIEKRPWSPQFGDCQVSINCDAKGMQWLFFKKWMEMINYFDTSNGIQSSNRSLTDSTGSNNKIIPYEIAYKDDIMSGAVELTSYDDSGQPVISITLNQAFPISLTNLRFDWGQTTQVLRFGVTFTYRDWFWNPTSATQSVGPQVPNFQNFTQ